ncbi:MAG: protein kinase [Vicinamibacterales bacterium]
MILTPGTRLGVYDITAQIGEGGMGQVYRATDTKLKRQVAIKILPPTLAADADRLARFQREAEVLASLNHPNIAAIYGLEESAGVTALVLELVGGEELSQRIARGAIPLDEALPIAKQIAEALEAAHEQGIVHRDLKPANIKVRADGTVKVLDFGLAKALDPAAASSAEAMNSPTLSLHATQAGMILGTAAYMSPEQARGKAVDRRADIWAFGVVLFEMITGHRAFAGAETSDVLAAVLRAEPEWTRLPVDTPAPIRTMLRRCLQKDAKKRLADAADARLEIDEVLAPPTGDATTTPVPSASRRWVMATVLLALTTLLLSALIVYNRRPGQFALPSPRPAAVVTLTFPGLSQVNAVAISPDGVRIVIAGHRAVAAGAARLYVRELNQQDFREIVGTEQAGLPFFSPDGRWIAFFTPRELKKVSIDGGTPIVLAGLASFSTSPNSLGGTWGTDQTILFSTGKGISRVGASGGSPEVVTTADREWHALPRFLTATTFLYSKWALSTSAPSFFEPSDANRQEIAVLGLDRTAPHTLVKGPEEAEYSQTGHLIYSQSGTLFAAPLDLRLLATGSPVPLAEGLRAGRLGGGFSVSSVNSLVYLPPAGSVQRELVWVDRFGRAQPVGAPVRPFVLPRLSPSGTRVVLTVQGNDDRSTWLYDVERRTFGRLSGDLAGQLPIWSPDGTRIAFEDLSKGNAFFIKSADDSGPTVAVDAPGANPALQSWSSDGRSLLYQVSGSTTDRDLWTVSLDGDRKATPIVQSRFFEGAGTFSPDGTLVAWVSQETGSNQVYLQTYPAGTGKVQVSADGGAEPVWSRSGKELFYRLDDKMLSVQVRTTPSLVVGKPTVLFEGRFEPYGGARPNYDVSPDGKRFLMLRAVADPVEDARVVYVAEWPQLLVDKRPITLQGLRPQ